ncbi:hypothetical protein CGRA01v4_10418 [Colletotrichum graminicola]|nr:hypothetical protein CGRA01v4_10418 [Colletotrichum graminicola]
MSQERGGVEGDQSAVALGANAGHTRTDRCLCGIMAGNKQRLNGRGRYSPNSGIITKDSGEEEMKAKKFGVVVGQGLPPTLASKTFM